MSALQPDTRSMALFCDFENVALGVEEAHYDRFDISIVLERLLLKGSIVVKKAYCDWDRYKAFKAAMHQASFELIEVPHVRQSGKNSADIRMVVDALDLCYTKSHVDTFVIISGDSDFSPLVSKLRENDKTVIGVGVKKSTSDLLMANCDEFIFYDDLVRELTPGSTGRRRSQSSKSAGGRKSSKTAGSKKSKTSKSSTDAVIVEPLAEPVGEPAPSATRGRKPVNAAAVVDARPVDSDPDSASTRLSKALDEIVDTYEALQAERGEDERIWGSMVKQTLKRRKPGFNETYYGFRSFNGLLEEAQSRGLLTLEQDDRSGGYVVRPIE